MTGTRIDDGDVTRTRNHGGHVARARIGGGA